MSGCQQAGGDLTDPSDVSASTELDIIAALRGPDPLACKELAIDQDEDGIELEADAVDDRDLSDMPPKEATRHALTHLQAQ